MKKTLSIALLLIIFLVSGLAFAKAKKRRGKQRVGKLARGCHVDFGSRGYREISLLRHPLDSSYRHIFRFFGFGPLAFLTSAEYGTGSAVTAP